MQLTFLCSKHTDWVYRHPEQAIHFLARDELQGTMLYLDGNYRECIAYLGCAFDIAYILLEVEEGQNQALAEKITMLGKMLAVAYEAQKQLDYKEAILKRTAQISTAHESMPYTVAISA